MAERAPSIKIEVTEKSDLLNNPAFFKALLNRVVTVGKQYGKKQHIIEMNEDNRSFNISTGLFEISTFYYGEKGFCYFCIDARGRSKNKERILGTLLVKNGEVTISPTLMLADTKGVSTIPISNIVEFFPETITDLEVEKPIQAPEKATPK